MHCPRQESIQKSLALSDQQLAIVLGAFWLAYGLFEIPGGWMGDRMGARFTLTRIVLAWSLFTALTGAATGFASLLLYRFLFGVGEAGAYPNIAHVQSRWLPITERARAGGVVWLCARSGTAFAPLIFGTITRSIDSAQLSLGESASFQWFREIESWRIAFFVSGVLGVFWCLAFYPWFRDDPAEKKSVGAAELQHIESGRGPIEAGHAMEHGMWGKLFTSPSLWAVAMYYVCGSFGWSFFVSWMPRYMKVAHGVAFEKSEWSSAWPLLSGGIACLVGGVLSDALVKRTGWRRLGRAVFPVMRLLHRGRGDAGDPSCCHAPRRGDLDVPGVGRIRFWSGGHVGFGRRYRRPLRRRGARIHKHDWQPGQYDPAIRRRARV